MTTALIMAGGLSQRMRASAGPTHKALVPILGLPLLERNILGVLSAGFRRIVVATNQRERDIVSYTLERGAAVARRFGADLTCFEEAKPLGTIGAAAAFLPGCDVLLIVNVDNLTALDLKRLVHHHTISGAVLTIATHQESSHLPFGEVIVSNGEIEAYKEKPIHQTHISSGTYVLNKSAGAYISQSTRTDLPDLVRELKKVGKKISAFEHGEPWIDVNDGLAILQAEELIAKNNTAFEYWDRPDCRISDVLLCAESAVLLEQRARTSPRYRGLWDLPAIDVLGQPALETTLLASFDDPDPTTDQLIRHEVFLAPLDSQTQIACNPNLHWVPFADITSLGSRSSALTRSLAFFAKIR